jgi:penicillin-binding protein 2
MQKVMSNVGAAKATAVALDPRSGEILAFVNLPSYDNNLFSKGISGTDYANLLNNKNNPLLPRAIAGEYPSGSSIKPFIAAGALQEGNINENSTVNSTGGIKVGEWEFPDWKKGGHGITNVTKAIAESVNTFFYAIGGGYGNIKGLGPDRMKHYLNLFGFGEDTGIDIGGELPGSIPDPVWKEKTKNEDWYLGDTYHMAIGQGDTLVTPLQIANATCAIANGGKLYKPRFVHEVVDENDKVLEVKPPEIIRKGFISPSNMDIVKRGMRQTVTSGSARSLNNLPVAISGKTGTAQFGPDEKKYHGWFTSFAPYDNPKIALTILVEGAGGGDETAVPIAKEVYKWYFGNR